MKRDIQSNAVELVQSIQQEAEKKVFFQEAVSAGLAVAPVKEVLDRLMNQVQTVDFLQFAVGEEVKAVHHRVYSVKELVRVAEANNWGLCKRAGAVYVFNGAYWVMLEGDDMKAFLGKAALKMGVPRFRADDYEFRDKLLKQFHSEAHLPAPDIDVSVTLINLQNGTFEITPEKQILRPFRREDFLTHQLPFSYQEKTGALRFQQYLDRVLPDKKSQQVLAEFCGYVFIRHLKLEKALLLYGSGANGKSVFYEVLRALLGEHNCSSYSLSSLTNSRNGYYRAMLQNKLVNYASEIHGRLEADIFKQLVSGEPVEARSPYEKPFLLQHYAKLVFNANELPKDIEHTHAYFRRFLIIPFTETIPEHEQDVELPQKIIAEELPGVFNWVLQGLERLLGQRKFSQCKAAEETLEQYKTESDSVKMFLDEQGYKPSIEKNVPLKDMYRDYKSFCAEDGYRALSNRNFSKRIKSLGFEVVKDTTRSFRVVYAENGFKPETDDLPGCF